MSSSFQSTAYQSFAQPVDTFVEPVNVLPKTDMMALADTLKVINPALEKFIETKIEEKRAEISEEALNDALDSSTKDWVITHNLGVQLVQVQVYNSASPFNMILTDIELTSSNTATIKFAQNVPTGTDYNVIVIG